MQVNMCGTLAIEAQFFGLIYVGCKEAPRFLDFNRLLFGSLSATVSCSPRMQSREGTHL